MRYSRRQILTWSLVGLLITVGVVSVLYAATYEKGTILTATDDDTLDMPVLKMNGVVVGTGPGGGGGGQTLQTCTANCAVASTSTVVACNATAGAVVVTIPDAATRISGATITPVDVKKVDATANLCTLQRTGTDTFEGLTSIVLMYQWQMRQLVPLAADSWGIFGQSVLLSKSIPLTSMSGDTVEAVGAIPAGSVVLFVRTVINTTLTGTLTGYSVGDERDPNLWGAEMVLTAGNGTDVVDYQVTHVSQVYKAATSIVITALGGGTISSGAMTVTVVYTTGNL